MRIELFKMERIQCLYENTVRYNLSESGVMPVDARWLLKDKSSIEQLLSRKLGYPPAGGSELLREHIAEYYGTLPENVRVTNGSSEANFMIFWALLEKSDQAAIMIPNYLQTWGLARHFARAARKFRLLELSSVNGTKRWGLDMESLNRAVGNRTRIILITNPNNPTGAVLTEEEMREVVRLADRFGAWIVADEVYRGADSGSSKSGPGFWGRYPKLLVVSGLSKAFGLPGLRTGWIVGPKKILEKLESCHDYLTLTPAALSDHLATLAMHAGRRKTLLKRTRKIIADQWPILERWIPKHPELHCIPPESGAIAFIRYQFAVSSVKLFERLRLEESVLVTPAAHFGLNSRYFRVGFGYDPLRLRLGLKNISRLFASLRT